MDFFYRKKNSWVKRVGKREEEREKERERTVKE